MTGERETSAKDPAVGLPYDLMAVVADDHGAVFSAIMAPANNA